MQPTGVSHKLCVFSLLLLALWHSGSCRSVKMATRSQAQHRVAAGKWGGQNVQLDVMEDGVSIRFSCARGSVEQSLTLDAEGRFSANGTFAAGAMGPSREDNPPKSRPAVYSGVVRDKVMTLTVTVADSKEEGGTFELTQGEPGHIRRCH
ncbi:MAG: hypothetical protein QOH49_3854 [Acidobacteriota bacterium]|jgi:hypothetical protein|nr:hypothetical protein [Acidobacteriota bacterium]